MKLKEKIKRFLTLDVHGHEGFTLVELIIVIAILAILSSVAVVGYSSYITKANKQVDMTLATEIEQALMLAYYEGTLKPGATITVYFDDVDVKIHVNAEGSDLGAEAALKAAFGDDYKKLRLVWNGWKNEMGVAADSAMMEYVNNSRFNSNTLASTLSQVQTVVDAASGFLGGSNVNYELDDSVKTYLDKAGVDYSNGVNSSNADAVANAMVFSVAESISTSEMDQAAYEEVWAMYVFAPSDGTSDAFQDTLGMNPISAAATKYAATLALAQFLDGWSANPANNVTATNFASRLGGEGEEILDTQGDIHSEMQTYMTANPAAQDAYAATMTNDANAFLAYMSGVTSSADSMIGQAGLNQSNYFNNGEILTYVNAYVAIGNALSGDANAQNGAFVFVFNGESVSCLPLDY